MAGKREDPFPSSALGWRGDFIISYLSPWIVPAPVLQGVRIAAINFHTGPPEYPGIGCTNFAIYNGESRYGVTAHHMAERVDSGPLIAVRRFPVHKEDTVFTLTRRCYENLRVLFTEVMIHFFSVGKLPESAEKWTKAPYTRGDLERLCEVSLEMPLEEIERRIRATTYPDMPGAYIDIYGHRFEYVSRSSGGWKNEQLPKRELSASKERSEDK